MAGQWTYRALGQEFGPVTFDELLNLAKQSQLSASDEVRLVGTAIWRRAGSIGRLMAELPFEIPTTTPGPARVGSASAAIPTAPAAADKPVSRPSPTPGKPAPLKRDTASTSTVAMNTVSFSTVAMNTVKTAERAVVQPATPAPAALRQEPAPSAPIVSDAGIQSDIRRELGSKGLSRLDVSVREGVASVGGWVASEGEKLLAVRLAEKIRGVRRVTDSIRVERAVAPPEIRRPMAPASAARSVSHGPGLMSWLIESVTGEHRNSAIVAIVLTGVIGYWFYPRGPVRPVAVHPVKGKVIMDGKPLANAAIVLHRVGESKVPANLHPRGKATGDGSFLLETFVAADGAPDGEFVATVFLAEETEVDGERNSGPNLLPVVYSKPETSPLKLKITSSTRELQPLQLTKGPQDSGG